MASKANLECTMKTGIIINVPGRCTKLGGIVVESNVVSTVQNRTFLQLNQESNTIRNAFDVKANRVNVAQWISVIKKAREAATDDLLQEAFKRGDDDVTVTWTRKVKKRGELLQLISPIVDVTVVTCRGVAETLHVLVDGSATGQVKVELTDASLTFLVNAFHDLPAAPAKGRKRKPSDTVKPFPEFPDVLLMENKIGENVLFCKYLQDGKRKQLTKTISKKLLHDSQQEAVHLTCRFASELQAQLLAMIDASESVQLLPAVAESSIGDDDDADEISVEEDDGANGKASEAGYVPEVVEEYD